MNPYREAARRQRRNRPRSLGWILPVVAALLAAPLLRPALLGFLQGPPRIADGIEAIAFRLGVVMAAAMSLHTYAALVRSPDRAVLDPHPVLARPLLDAVALETMRERAYLPIVGALVLSPIAAAGFWPAWVGTALLGFGCWFGALGAGFAIHLAAVWVGHSSSAAAILDALRGANPRMQAALIYAPGVVLLTMGIASGVAAAGLRAALDGLALGWLWLLLPVALGAIGLALARTLAETQYVRATALLAEVDAEWALVEQKDDPTAVYLEWVPVRHAEVLRALRQGWRQIRTWPVGAWLLGIVAAGAAWAPDDEASGRALLYTAGAACLIAAIPTRLAEGDPPWLDESLGVRRLSVALARAWVAWLYAQGVLLPAALALLVRHGAADAIRMLPVEGLVALCAFGAAAAASMWRGRGVWVYAPFALLLVASVYGGALT